MINPSQLKAFFPPNVSEQQVLHKYMVKEYLHMLLMEFLASTPFIRQLAFIGGTNLRLSKGINRFSEDLDFDCKDLSEAQFVDMTDQMVVFLKNNGYRVETKERPSEKRTAFLRNIFFPGLLFDMGLSAHPAERFLIKVEAEDQQIPYERVITNLQSCGMFLGFPAPTNAVLCAMKIGALLSRQKGRDFYDTMFLWGQTEADYDFLTATHGIRNREQLKNALLELCTRVNLHHKAKDFEHLCFSPQHSQRILHFESFVRAM